MDQSNSLRQKRSNLNLAGRVLGGAIILGGTALVGVGGYKAVELFIDGRRHPELYGDYAQRQENNSLTMAGGLFLGATGLYLFRICKDELKEPIS
jgi:hypothetical protein